MVDFQESLAKKIVRSLIFENLLKLNESGKFVYLGLPGRSCGDLSLWKDNIKYAYCCESSPERFYEMQMNMHRLAPGKTECCQQNLWERMKEECEHFIDLLNLDFCGGPSSSEVPEVRELNSLANFFKNQRNKEEKPFFVAWTLGVRNTNHDFYKSKNIEFLKETYSLNDTHMKLIDNWLSKSKKMIKNYLYFIPCITFDYAQNSRYLVQLVESLVYKKIMYFGLFKVIPKSDIVSRDDKLNFYKSVFEKKYRVYDENAVFKELISFPLGNR